jgi:hypothetical protein
VKLPSYNASVFGITFNYSHLAAYQMYEIRYCPVAAIVLLAGSLAALLWKKRDPVALAKVLFAAAMGPLGFSFLRLMLFAPFSDELVWFTFWEEATEMIFIAAVAYVLWVFRRGLMAGGDRPRLPPA